MNRKRKSTEILAQLGEPLPLPYQAPPTRPKNEPNELEQPKKEPTFGDFGDPPVAQPLSYGSGRKRRLFERREGSENRDSGPETAAYNHHVALPIWRRDRGPSGASFDPENEAESDSDEKNEPSILHSLQQQLDIIKTLYTSKDALDADAKQFEKVENELSRLIERKQQESIVHELERIQNSVLLHGSKGSKWRPWFWVVGLISLLSASFLAGQFSYEYCYYFC